MVFCLKNIIIFAFIVSAGYAEWEQSRVEDVFNKAATVLNWQKGAVTAAEQKRFAQSCKEQIEDLGFGEAHPVWAFIGVLAAEVDPAYNQLARDLIKTHETNPSALQQVTGYSWDTKQGVSGLNNEIYCAIAGHPSWKKPGSYAPSFQADRNQIGLLKYGCCPGIQAIAASYWNINPLQTFEPILFGANDTQTNRELGQANWRYWRAGFLGHSAPSGANDNQKLQLLFGASCSKTTKANKLFDALLPGLYDKKQDYLTYNSALFSVFGHADALINLRPENMHNRDIVTDNPASPYGGGNPIYVRDLEKNASKFPAVTLHNLIDVFVKNNQIPQLKTVVGEIVRRASALKITPVAGQKIDQTEQDNAKWLCETFQQAWRTAARLNNMQAMGILAENFGKLKNLGSQTAVSSGDMSVVNLGKTISNTQAFASSALEAAVDGCSVDAFAALLQAGADVQTSTLNSLGLTRPIAAYVALKMIELVKQAGPLPSETDLTQLLSFIQSQSIAAYIEEKFTSMTIDMRNLLDSAGADVNDWDAKIHHAQDIQEKRLAYFLSVMQKLTMPDNLSKENKHKINNYIVMLLLLEGKGIDVKKALFDASMDRISQRDEFAFLKFLSDVFSQAKLAKSHFGEVIGLALPEAAQKALTLANNTTLLQLK